MDIQYKINQSISVNQFVDLLRESTLGERRPVDDLECMSGMLSNGNLTITAWHGDKLVGIARSVTDFHYACYLSDLAVHKSYQRAGIGKELQILTQQKNGPRCKLILIAAPDANAYYEHIGFGHDDRCWVLQPNDSINR